MFSVKARTRWKSLSFRFHYKFENHISGSLKGWLRVMLQGLVCNECGWFMSFAAELGIVHCFDLGSGVCSSKLSLCVEVSGNSLHRGLGGSISMRNSGFLIALNAGFISIPHHLLWCKLAWFHVSQLNCSVAPRWGSNLTWRTKESSILARSLHKSIWARIANSPSLARGSHCHFADRQTHRLRAQPVHYWLNVSHIFD